MDAYDYRDQIIDLLSDLKLCRSLTAALAINHDAAHARIGIRFRIREPPFRVLGYFGSIALRLRELSASDVQQLPKLFLPNFRQF
jgi:hypothetical protein